MDMDMDMGMSMGMGWMCPMASLIIKRSGVRCFSPVRGTGARRVPPRL